MDSYTDLDGLRKKIAVHPSNEIFEDDADCVRKLMEEDVGFYAGRLIPRIRILQHLVVVLLDRVATQGEQLKELQEQHFSPVQKSLSSNLS